MVRDVRPLSDRWEKPEGGRKAPVTGEKRL